MQQWLTGHKLKNRPYEILQELGQGGFGITYKAKNLKLDIPVVIKTPNSRLQRDKNYSKYIKSFSKEAKKLAKLGMNPHPHIVRVFDFFEEDNLPCIVMDYVPGNSLYDIVQMNGALPEEQALEYIKQIGSALSVCHQQGIIHRDVHPNNILIHANSGNAILIDFGISGSTQTSRSNRSGNQAFAPWEQLISFGEQSSKTPQVDIYTLAASFYYLVTGDTPTPSLARKFNNDELKEPKQYNTQLSDRINEAILKGMEIKVVNRSQTVEAWLDMLKPLKPKLASIAVPKVAVQNEYTDPPTVPVLSKAKRKLKSSIPEKTAVKLLNHSELKSKIPSDSNSRYKKPKSTKTSQRLVKYEREVKTLLNKGLNPNSYYFKQLVYQHKTKLKLSSRDVYTINERLNISDNYTLKQKANENENSDSVKLSNYEIKIKGLLNQGLNPNSYYFQERAFQYKIRLGLNSNDVDSINKKLKINNNLDVKNGTLWNVIGAVMCILIVILISFLANL